MTPEEAKSPAKAGQSRNRPGENVQDIYPLRPLCFPEEVVTSRGQKKGCWGARNGKWEGWWGPQSVQANGLESKADWAVH